MTTSLSWMHWRGPLSSRWREAASGRSATVAIRPFAAIHCVIARQAEIGVQRSPGVVFLVGIHDRQDSRIAGGAARASCRDSTSQDMLRQWRSVGRICLTQVEARAIEVVLVEQGGETRFEHDAFE